MNEIWKDIDGYDQYQISSLGRIRNKNTDRIRKTFLKPGRKYEVTIQLHKNSIKKTYNLHRLVAKHFLENYDDNLIVMHIDENLPVDVVNSVSNLKMSTQSENMKDCFLKNRKSHSGKNNPGYIDGREMNRKTNRNKERGHW